MNEEPKLNFRSLTPIVLSVLSILVTILIFVVGILITEIRASRVENKETRDFAVKYTDKMVELILKTNERKR